MDFTNDTKIGVQVGEEAVARVVQHADDIRTNQSKYLSVTNEPHLVALRGQLAWLETRRRDLRDRLQYLPPVGDARVRWRRCLFCWTVAIVLAGAGFFLALLTLEPYQFGWKGYLCCIGIAIAVPFLVDLLLEEIGSPRLVKGLVIVASTAGLTGVVLLASVRGDLLATQIQSAAPAIEVDDAAASPTAPTDFYGNTLGRQRLLMELLALAMELGAALAIYQARRHGLETSDNPYQVRQALGETETQMLRTVAEIRRREIEPEAFEAAFRRDFSRAVLNGTRRALTKYLPVVVLLLLGRSGHVLAAEHRAFVVAIDLTQSVAARDATDASEFAKNCAAVKQFLSRVPAGSSVTVLGISDRSFAQPALLITARVDDNPGYFDERLATARRELVRLWKTRQASLTPNAAQTDLLGMLFVAAERLQHDSGAKPVLVIFSDMRHDTAALTLERHRLPPTAELLATVTRQRLLADLRGVQVFVLGADAAGRTIGQWQAVRDFWVAYFREAGAVLKNYTVLRDIPESIFASNTK